MRRHFIVTIILLTIVFHEAFAQCPNCPADLSVSGTFCGPCSFAGNQSLTGNIVWASSGASGGELTVGGNLFVFGSLTVNEDSRINVGGTFRTSNGGTSVVNGYVSAGFNLGVSTFGNLSGNGYITYGNNSNFNGTVGGVFASCVDDSGVCGDASTLPVELTSFGVRLDQGQALLTWTTATELINEGFDVEKSTDGKNWNKIGFVEGNGTTDVKQYYSYTDTQLQQDSFYRLKQLDYDGKFEYSPIIFIPANGDPLVGPNPASDKIRFAGNDDTSYTFSAFDMTGKSVMPYDQMTIIEAEEYFDFLLPRLPRGTYIIKLQNPGYNLSMRLLKN